MATKHIEIYEDNNEQEGGSVDYSHLMTEEQIRRGEYYSQQYRIRRGEIDTQYKQEWDRLWKLYECERAATEDDPDFPNSFVPIITPTVEGQVASMTEADIDFRHVTNNPGHQSYMKTLDAISEFYRKKSRYKLNFKDFARSYNVIGNAWITLSWKKCNSNEKGPGGYPKITIPNPLSVLPDGKIKDVKDIQDAEYIIHEIGFQPISWARKEYGDEYADAIISGFNRYESDDAEPSYDDTNTFMLLNVWTRSNEQGNLQLIQMDANGLILYESDPDSPYYKYVNNEYPFGIARMIPSLGSFYGKGDGHILRRMQETINNLTDELELAARFSAQSRIFVDPAGKMAPEQITSDPSDPVICIDPRNNIFISPSAGINPVVQTMIEYLLRESQKATRFHESMTGNQKGTSATATQINTQLAQGTVGIKDKKNDIADVMSWADMYAINLCIERWDKGFWANVSNDYSIWIDPEELEKVPATVPVKSSTIGKTIKKMLGGFKGIGDSGTAPKTQAYEQAKDGKDLITTQLDFSTKVIIGESIPKGRTDMYNILLGLSQMTVMNKDGQPEPLISANRLREAMEDVLGMKLKTEQEENEDVIRDAGQMMQDKLNMLNPIGNEEKIQTPTAPNLQQTVPQQIDEDNRRVQL